MRGMLVLVALSVLVEGCRPVDRIDTGEDTDPTLDRTPWDRCHEARCTDQRP